MFVLTSWSLGVLIVVIVIRIVFAIIVVSVVPIRLLVPIIVLLLSVIRVPCTDFRLILLIFRRVVCAWLVGVDVVAWWRSVPGVVLGDAITFQHCPYSPNMEALAGPGLTDFGEVPLGTVVVRVGMSV